ncbi:hypothetical protein RN001_003080 [Aquatica leii]|uniref:Uncharacterized protein n=1 Tax=Aquatica leii TaxID=1421715 RepID=A0AAN7PHT6_9COLE|nr:hypothetical protein RN001_003080 [Aquatica leii]
MDIRGTHEQMKKQEEEIKTLREELKRRDESWQIAKYKLQQEVKILKKRLEAQEKNSKKNNIIIKGTTAQDNNLKECVTELINKETGATIEVETAYKIGKQEPKMVIAKLKNFEQKMEVIKNKYKLGGKMIYIDSDLTYEEQKTQSIIRKIAKEEKNKGNIVQTVKMWMAYAEQTWTKAVDFQTAVQRLVQEFSALEFDAEHEAVYGFTSPELCATLAEKYQNGQKICKEYLETKFCSSCLINRLSDIGLSRFANRIKRYMNDADTSEEEESAEEKSTEEEAQEEK